MGVSHCDAETIIDTIRPTGGGAPNPNRNDGLAENAAEPELAFNEGSS
jgi:hypothetical protein